MAAMLGVTTNGCAAGLAMGVMDKLTVCAAASTSRWTVKALEGVAGPAKSELGAVVVAPLAFLASRGPGRPYLQ